MIINEYTGLFDFQNIITELWLTTNINRLNRSILPICKIIFMNKYTKQNKNE